MKHRSRFIIVGLILICTSLNACGGSSSDSGMLIEGTLTEAGGAGHTNSLGLKHSVGQRIENVEICALSECSTTDSEGQWGFVVPESFTGGDALFSFKGHGIDTSSVVMITDGAKEVFVDFRHVEGGHIEVHHITIDGETSPMKNHEDEEHKHE